MSFLTLYAGDWDEEAQTALSALVQRSAASGDSVTEVQARQLQAVSLAVTGELEQALEVSHAALELSDKTQRPYDRAKTLNNLISIHLNLGQTDEATPLLDEALGYAAEHGLKSITGALLFLRAEAQLERGEYALAREDMMRAEEIFLPLQRWKDLYFVYRIRGLSYFLGHSTESPPEHLDLAASDFVQAERLMAGYGVNKHMNLLLPQLGDVLLAKVELDAAEQFFRSELEEAREEGITPKVMNDLLGLGRVLLVQGRADEALPYLQESLSLVTNPPSWCLTVEIIAAAVAMLGDTNLATYLLGAAQAEREKVRALRYRVYTEDYEAAAAEVRSQMGQAFDEAFAEGRNWSKDRATQEALVWKPD